MKGDPDVLARLDDLLTDELTSADLYLYFSRHLRDQGYVRLYERLAHEADDEMLHAKQLVERIILLGGDPNVLRRRDKPTPKDPKAILEESLEYELEVAKKLNEAIRVCDEKGDAGSRMILDQLLSDTEDDHVDWLEAQLHLIEQIGLEAYLAEQVGPSDG